MSLKRPRIVRLLLPVYYLFALISIVSCGGGSGNGNNNGSANDVFSLSAGSLDFVAETPGVVVAAQSITGTINADLVGTLYIIVDVSGNAVASVSNFTINQTTRSGTANISVEPASIIGVGTHSSTLTISACLDDPTCNTGELSGSPKTMDVSYLVKPSVKADTMMPHSAIANQSGEVTIRGNGFVSNNVTGITFGGNNAVSFSLVSDSEIQAIYPSLVAGDYPVQLSNASGVVSYSASLNLVDAPGHTADTLSYPTAPQQTLALVYDTEREALLVAASYFDGINFNTSSRMLNQIIRYQFSNGVLTATTMLTVPLLQDLDLSPDGQELLAITDTQVIHLNPVTLSQNSAVTNSALSTSTYLKNIVVTNDANAIITTGLVGSGNSTTYLYPLSLAQFYPSDHSCTYNGSSGVSANGALATMIQGSLSPAQPLCEYDSSTGIFAETLLDANQRQCINSFMGKCIGPVIDRSGNKIAVIDNTFTVTVYDRNFSLLGALPDTHGDAVFSPDGNTLYSYDASGLLRSFALDQPTVSGVFVEIGSGITLAGNPGAAATTSISPTEVVKITTTVDGSTVFIAGENLVAIQPVP